MKKAPIHLPLPSFSFISIILFICLIIFACGPSDEEIRAQERAKYDKLIEQIKSKFNPVLFPGDNISNKPFTCELREFFQQNTEKMILFEGHLEDVEEKNNCFVVEITCPIDKYDYDGPVIVFNLNTNTEQVKNILKIYKNSLKLRNGGTFEPECLVITKIKNVKRIRRYEPRYTVYGNELVEVEIDTLNRFIAEGELVEVIALP